MPSHTARVASALFFLAPLAPLAAQNLEYAAGTTRYRINTTNNVVQTSPMGTQTFDVAVKQQITVNIMKHATDTTMATLTVDSVAMTGAPPGVDVGKLMGAKFTSLISPTGKFYSTKGPDGLDPQLVQLSEGVGRFMPAYRGDIAAGKSWSDTLSGTVQQNGMPVNRTAISNYTVAGDTSVNGQTSFKIHRVTSVKATGAGSMQGMAVTLETTGASSGDFFLTHKGVYLGGESKDDATVKIIITGQNAEINLKQSQRTSVEAIK